MTEVAPTPAFRKPPVGEVAIGIQFDPLPALGSFSLGRLWDLYRERYPDVEEQAPLAPIFEELSPGKWIVPGPQVSVVQGSPATRFMFKSSDSTRLLQVQQDRFVHNWRRMTGSDVYPHYATLRTSFLQEYEVFVGFLRTEELGEPGLNQCEVTYSNPIPRDGVWTDHGQLDRVVTVWQNKFSDDFLREPQDVRFAERHLITNEDGERVARLHVTLDPVYRTTDGEPLLLLQLIGRGAPTDKSLDSALSLLDLEHEWVVRGFASVTRREMHELWEREHA